MQKKLLKNLLIVLTMVVLCFAVGMTASAEDRTVVDSGECGAQGDNVIWTLYDDGELVISGEGEMKEYTSSSDVPWEQYKYSSINSLIVENGVKSLSWCAFYWCQNLINIALPENLEHIGSKAFEGTAYYNNSENWDSGVFYVDEYLIDMQEDFVGEYKIKDGTLCIVDDAISQCDYLTSIEIPTSVTYIDDEAFLCCNSLENIFVDSNNKNYCAEDGVLFNKDKTVLIQYPIGNERKSYTIPDGVTSINNYAFFQASDLTSITFPNSLLTIGEQAFDWCFGITDITIPTTVENIGLGAFADVFFLEKIIIKSINVKLDEYLFVPSEGAYFDNVTYEEILPLWKRYLIGDDSAYDEIDKYFVYIESIEDIVWFGTIYCHAGSTAETYAIENGADYVLTHFFEGDWTYDYDNMIRYRKCIHCDELETEALETTTDSDVEIIEPADPDTDFVVDVITDYVVIEETISNNVAGDFEIVKAFDITMKNKDGVHVQPDGTVKVKLPLDWSKDGIYKVYRVNDDGTLTDMNAYREGSHMVFETDHFSVYVIVDESEKADEPTAPDEPQEETKKDFFSKIIDWFRSLIDLIISWFKK